MPKKKAPTVKQVSQTQAAYAAMSTVIEAVDTNKEIPMTTTATTPAFVVPAIAQTAANLLGRNTIVIDDDPAYVRSLEMLDGTKITTSLKNGVLHFGDFKAPRSARLTTHEEAMGFINALSDVKTGKYPVLKPGIHLKHDHLSLALMFDMPKDRYHIGYVNFHLLKDEGEIEWLKEEGIVPDKESERMWLALKCKDCRVYVDHAVQPKKGETLKAVFEEKDGDNFEAWVRNNAWDWDIVRKHQGLEYVLALLDGTGQAALMPITDKTGFEQQAEWRQLALDKLFGETEALEAFRIESIQAARTAVSTSIQAGILRKNPANMQTLAAQAATEKFRAYVVNEYRDITLGDLVGRTVYARIGEMRQGCIFFVKDLAKAAAVLQQISGMRAIPELTK